MIGYRRAYDSFRLIPLPLLETVFVSCCCSAVSIFHTEWRPQFSAVKIACPRPHGDPYRLSPTALSRDTSGSPFNAVHCHLARHRTVEGPRLVYTCSFTWYVQKTVAPSMVRSVPCQMTIPALKWNLELVLVLVLYCCCRTRARKQVVTAVNGAALSRDHRRCKEILAQSSE